MTKAKQEKKSVYPCVCVCVQWNNPTISLPSEVAGGWCGGESSQREDDHTDLTPIGLPSQ